MEASGTPLDVLGVSRLPQNNTHFKAGTRHYVRELQKRSDPAVVQVGKEQMMISTLDVTVSRAISAAAFDNVMENLR
jgi:hypothetical protein